MGVWLCEVMLYKLVHIYTGTCRYPTIKSWTCTYMYIYGISIKLCTCLQKYQHNYCTVPYICVTLRGWMNSTATNCLSYKGLASRQFYTGVKLSHKSPFLRVFIKATYGSTFSKRQHSFVRRGFSRILALAYLHILASSRRWQTWKGTH